MDIFLPSFHFLMIFTTVAFVVGEFFLLRLEPTVPLIKTLSRLDMGYGIAVILVVISGLLRVFLGDEPASHWAANHAFWTKMGLFAVVGALSVLPSIRYFQWAKAAAAGPLPDLAARKKVALFVHLEMALLALMPIMAVLMASDE